MNHDDCIEYNALWRFPEHNTPTIYNLFQDCVGTLRCYKNKPSILEIHHKPSIGTISNMCCNYNTIWGKDANGYVFTLFNATMISQTDFSKTVFSIGYCLVGKNVKSIDTPIFDGCIVHFPYLRNWAFNPLRNIASGKCSLVTELNTTNVPPILEWDIEDNITLQLHRDFFVNNTRYETIIKEDTLLLIKSREQLPISRYLKLIYIFKQFLSIALFGEQQPCRIEFKVASETNVMATKLLYRVNESYEPYIIPLLDFNKISYKIPDMLRKWYSNYEQMSPIIKYFVQAITELKNEFDTPDFLIIAQALDGYHKRFVNKKDGKDIRKYKEQIDKLLEHFKGVLLLKKCNLNTEVLTHSRHKYSHLIPDEENKNVEKAVEGEELYYLTKKCIVLLTCCILDNLGLTIEEINLCFKDSAIERMVNDIPFWYLDKEKRE